jgi:hypothetical protein
MDIEISLCSQECTSGSYVEAVEVSISARIPSILTGFLFFSSVLLYSVSIVPQFRL